MSEYDASAIDVLTLAESVRKRPAMYVGELGAGGVCSMFWWLVADALERGATAFRVSVEEARHTRLALDCEDEGLHPEAFGVATASFSGLAVTAVLSEQLELQSFRDGVRYSEVFCRGESITGLRQHGRTDRAGTRVAFVPDRWIFAEPIVGPAIERDLETFAGLFPTVEVSFNGEETDGGWSPFLHFVRGLLTPR